MKKFKHLLTKQWFAYTFAACSAVLLYVIISNLPAVAHALKAALAFLSPIIIGVITAYLLNPVSNFFEQKLFKKVKTEGGRHTGGVIITLICFVLVFVLLLVALIPSLVQSVSKLVKNWNSYVEMLDGLFVKAEELLQKVGIKVNVGNLSALVDNLLDKLLGFVRSNTNKIMKTAGNIGSRISNAAIGIVIGFCFLAAKKTLVDFVKKLRYAIIKKETAKKNDEIWKSCHEVFLRYIGCTLLDALIIGVATLVFMLVFGLPYAPLIAVVVAVTNIIPTVGPMIGGGIGIFFLVLDKPINALWFLIFVCALQSLDGLVIKPNLFKGSLGIPAVWTLALIILGGKVGGMLGIILAIPAAAIVVILYKEILAPKLEKRKMVINGEEEEDSSETAETAEEGEG